MNKLNSFYVVPAQTFFKWGFTIPKNHYSEYIKYFDFKEGNLVQPIKIKIDNRSLNYETYFEKGSSKILSEDYTSHNTNRLNNKQLTKILLKIPEINKLINK